MIQNNSEIAISFSSMSSTFINWLMIQKQTANLFFLFAIVARLLYLYCFPLQETDYQMLHTAADNFLHGNGLGFTRSQTNDLTLFYFEGLRLWPPLTPIILALTKYFVHTAFWADQITISLSVYFILLFVKRIMIAVSVNSFYQSLVWIFLITNPETIKMPGLSDLLGCLFFLFAFLLCLYWLKRIKLRILSLITYSFIFFLPAAVRYQYYPIIFIFPVCIIFSGWFLSEIKLIRGGFLSLLFVICFLAIQELGLFLLTQKSLNAPLIQDETGFFPSNLLLMYPVILKTFMNSGYLENKFLLTHSQLNKKYLLISVVSIFLLIIISLFYFSKNLLTSKKNKNLIFLTTFIAFLSSAGVICTLIFLSLSHNSRNGLPGGWTYVADGRYYIGPSILILIFATKYLQENRLLLKKPVKKLMKFCLIFLLLYNSTLLGKFIFNIYNHKIPDKELENRKDRVAIEKIIRHLATDSLPVIATYSSNYFAFYPVQNNYAVTQKLSVLADSGYATSHSAHFLIITSGRISEKQYTFIKRNRAAEIYKGKESTVFYIKLAANSKSNQN